MDNRGKLVLLKVWRSGVLEEVGENGFKSWDGELREIRNMRKFFFNIGKVIMYKDIGEKNVRWGWENFCFFKL